MDFEYLVGFVFWLVISLIVIVYVYKKNKNSKDLKQNLIQSAILPLILTIAFGYFFVEELKQKNTITQQRKTEKQETITKNQETKKQTTTTINNQQVKKEQSIINDDNNIENILLKQTQKRNNFAIISTTKMLFSKFSHKDFLNYFEKLLNDKEIKYIILILDNNKNYYINTSSLIVEVELNKDFSIKKEIEWFIYKDGYFSTEEGKIFAK